MTIEETIYALDIVEHMDSFSVLYEPGEPMNQTTVGKLKEACGMAVSILRARTDTPPNDPLTMEELREMDGEPVWVVPLNDFEILPANYLVNAYAEQIVVDKFGAYLDFEDYGKTWLAYRRKPGEESG